MSCPKCGYADVLPWARFCPHCSAATSEPPGTRIDVRQGVDHVATGGTVVGVQTGPVGTLNVLTPPPPPPVPRAPALNEEVVGQTALKRELVEALMNQGPTNQGPTIGLTALKGLPGVGKTTLALWVANRKQIAEAFPDGVLWASLGPEPDVNAELGR
jgi:hypothetical protein